MDGKKIEVKHLPSDYPKTDEAAQLEAERIAEEEARWGEERSLEAGEVDPE